MTFCLMMTLSQMTIYLLLLKTRLFFSKQVGKIYLANISCKNFEYLTSLMLSKIFHYCLEGTKSTSKLVGEM